VIAGSLLIVVVVSGAAFLLHRNTHESERQKVQRPQVAKKAAGKPPDVPGKPAQVVVQAPPPDDGPGNNPPLAVEPGEPIADSWKHLDTTHATIMKDFLRLEAGPPRVPCSPQHRLFTKQPVAGPVEITVVARTESNIRLLAFDRGQIILLAGANSGHAVFHPDGSIAPQPAIGPLEPNHWYTLRWLIGEGGMKIFFENKRVLSARHPNKLDAAHPIVLCSMGSIVDVKRFDVKQLVRPKIANGLSGDVDCTGQGNWRPLGKKFDTTKSWEFSFELQVPDLQRPRRFFALGKDRTDLIFVEQEGNLLRTGIGADAANTVSVAADLSKFPRQSWINVVFRYLDVSQEIELVVDKQLIERKRSPFVPRAIVRDVNATVFNGEVHGLFPQFGGKLKGVWLGNR
jgi:hypothetical protein